MNNLQLAILAKAFEIDSRVPNPVYRTHNRFGPDGFDCSGYTWVCYRDGAGIRIGADTGAIARDVPSKAVFRLKNQLQPADLLMRRRGSIYNGGSDEHVGLFISYEGSSIWSRESAGSQNGVGLYRRHIDFWTNGVHYHAVGGGGSLPGTPQGGFLNMLSDKEQRALYNAIVNGREMQFVNDGKSDLWWLTDGLFRRPLIEYAEAQNLVELGMVRPEPSPDGKIHPKPCAPKWLNRIPIAEGLHTGW